MVGLGIFTPKMVGTFSKHPKAVPISKILLMFPQTCTKHFWGSSSKFKAVVWAAQSCIMLHHLASFSSATQAQHKAQHGTNHVPNICPKKACSFGYSPNIASTWPQHGLNMTPKKSMGTQMNTQYKARRSPNLAPTWPTWSQKRRVHLVFF